jgi:CRISPR-associated protein Csd1
VNFNKNSFYSYDKEGGENATIGIGAVSKYSEALSHLLRTPANKTVINDTTMMFWAVDKDSRYAELFLMLENPPKKDEQDVRQARLIKDILSAVKAGRKLSLDEGLSEDKQFYILGLAPNAARLSIRFFLTGTFGSFVTNLANFWNAMEIEGFEPKPLKQVLAEIAIQRKFENIPPPLAGRVLSSILSGGRLPLQFYTAALERMRIPLKDEEKKYEKEIYAARAAITKAYLIKNRNKEIGMGLNRNETDIGYRLGRLFATLQTAQYKAMGNLNATVADRFLAAAMTTPSNVFPTIFNMNAKYDNPVYIDREIGEIMDGIAKFPHKLDLDGQGMFVLGYYHQRQENFNKAKEHKND